jgi:glycosyltransferase involved in cell wall biosynthesis
MIESRTRLRATPPATAVANDEHSGAAPPRTVVFVQPTSEVGGSDIALYRLVTNLDRSRFRPVVVMPREGPLTARFRAAGVHVRVLSMPQLRSVRDLRHQAGYLLRFWPSVLRLALLLRRERAAIVHSNSLYCLHGAWAALFARVPHVWHIREIPDVPRPARSLLLAMAVRLSVRVIAMTEAVGAMFDGRLRKRGPKVVTVPDGIDLSAFHPGCDGARIRHELGIASDAPVAGFVARLDPWKGAEVFVRAAAAVSKQLPDARFIVCGGELPGYESYADGLVRLASELGLDGRLHFTGWTYNVEAIPDVMAALDVLVHTSVRPEPFGLVLVEAMATAKPVVAARHGGVPEVVDEGVTGLLVEPGDWQGYAAAMLDVLRDATRAGALGAAGRTRAERLFDVRAYARIIEAMYGGILKPPREVLA